MFFGIVFIIRNVCANFVALVRRTILYKAERTFLTYENSPDINKRRTVELSTTTVNFDNGIDTRQHPQKNFKL